MCICVCGTGLNNKTGNVRSNWTLVKTVVPYVTTAWLQKHDYTDAWWLLHDALIACKSTCTLQTSLSSTGRTQITLREWIAVSIAWLMYVRVCVCACIPVWIYVCACIYVCVFVCVRMCMCVSERLKSYRTWHITTYKYFFILCSKSIKVNKKIISTHILSMLVCQMVQEM